MPARPDPDWSPARAHAAKLLLARVRKAGGGNRLQQVHMYPELIKLRADGWTYRDMVKYIGAAGGPKTVRAYQIIVQKQRELREPRDVSSDLQPDLQALLQWNFDAFKAFFLRYSPHDYLPVHVEPWIRSFLRERRLMLNVPPGHAKSEFFMIWIPTWLIVRDRNVQILMVSNSSDDAATWAMEVAGQLEHNEELVSDFGRFAPESVGDQRWNPAKGVFSVHGRTRKMKGAQFTMESRGMTGRVLGRRADFVLIDDPTKQEEAESPTTRKRQLDHLRQQVFTRAEPEGEWQGGRICVIGQRVHLLDCYGELEKQKWERGEKVGRSVWHTEKYPAVLDWDAKKTLWPQRWPWAEIELAYASVGGHAAFSCMYQQEPMPEGEAMFDHRVLEACKDHARPAYKGYRGQKDQNGYLPIVRVVSVDPSPTKYHGIVVGDVLADRNTFGLVVTEMHRVQPGVERMKAEVDRIMAAQRPDYLIFEESGFLAWFKDDPWFQELKTRTQYLGHHTGANKNTMEYGVQSLAGDFELGHISLPYGDMAAKQMTDLLISEAVIYPFDDIYDVLMALWFIKFNWKKLRPFRALPGHFRGSTGKGWSFLKKRPERDPWKEKSLVG